MPLSHPQLSKLPRGLIPQSRENSAKDASLEDSIGNFDLLPLPLPQRPFNPEVGSSNATTNVDSVERTNQLSQRQADIGMLHVLLQEEDSVEVELDNPDDTLHSQKLVSSWD